jgi:hypothetical protein
MDVGETALVGDPGSGLDHAAVERHESSAVTCDDAIAGVGKAGIDSKDNHPGKDSAPRLGRLP